MTNVDMILTVLTVVASGLAGLAALYNRHYTNTAAEARLAMGQCKEDRATLLTVSKDLLHKNMQLRGQVQELKGLLGRLGDDHLALIKDNEQGLRQYFPLLDALQRLHADQDVLLKHKAKVERETYDLPEALNMQKEQYAKVLQEKQHVQNLYQQAAATAQLCKQLAGNKHNHYLASIQHQNKKIHQALKQRREALLANNDIFNANARMSKQMAHLQHVLQLQKDKYQRVLREKQHLENLLDKAAAAAHNYKRVGKLHQAFILIQKNKYDTLMKQRDQALQANKDLVHANARIMHEMAHLHDNLNTHKEKYEEVLHQKQHAQSLHEQTLAAAQEYKRAAENNENLYLAFILTQKKKYDQVVKERDDALLAKEDLAKAKDKLLDDFAQHIDEIESKFKDIVVDMDGDVRETTEVVLFSEAEDEDYTSGELQEVATEIDEALLRLQKIEKYHDDL